MEDTMSVEIHSRLFGLTKFLLFICLLALILPAEAAAQAVSGTLLGSATDANGAAIAGVKIALTHTQTGLTRVITSDSAGEYVAPNLPPGEYTIVVEHPGFKKLQIGNVQLSVDQKAVVGLKMEVGATTESVTVEGSTPLVQTQTSDLSGTINERQIANLPLNGRNFVQLTRTLPGVQRGIPGANIDGAGSLAWRASASFSANGMRTRDNNFILDGVDNNETWLNSVVIFPSIDALDANDFFNNKNGRAKPPYRQNQFGGTFGGPIRHDKMFFF